MRWGSRGPRCVWVCGLSNGVGMAGSLLGGGFNTLVEIQQLSHKCEIEGCWIIERFAAACVRDGEWNAPPNIFLYLNGTDGAIFAIGVDGNNFQPLAA